MAKLPGIYEYMATMGAPAINFGRGLLGYQDPFLTQTMQDRMKEIEGGRTQGNVGYDEYGLVPSAGRFTGGLMDLAINRPADFALAGSIGKYDFGPEGRKGLEYNFTPDPDTGSTGSAMLDFINRGGVKGALSRMGTAQAAEVTPQNEPMDIEDFLGTSTPQDLGFIDDAPQIKEAIYQDRIMNPNLPGFAFQPKESLRSIIGSQLQNAKTKLNQGFDFTQQLPGMAISAAMGVPFVGQGIIAGLNALQDLTGPNYRAMIEKDLGSQGFTIDDIGRVVQTGDYATPENIMAGYNIASPGFTGAAFDRYDKIREGLRLGKFKNVQRAKDKLDALGKAALEKERARKAAYEKAIQDAKNAERAERARIKSISAGYGGHDDSPGATGPTAAGAGMGVGGGYASDYGFLRDGGLASLAPRRG